MEHQADPSAPLRLLDLPVSCLHHIVSFMDKKTRLQFFRSSKGSQHEPGCAVMVLRAFKLQFTYSVQPDNVKPRPALCSLLHWASQISADLQLTIACEPEATFPLMQVLHSLLLYPSARATRSGRVLGKPATYPAITSLEMYDYTCSSLIPDLVADVFPNLKSLTGEWSPDASQPLGPMLRQGFPSLEHVDVSLDDYALHRKPAKQHIAQQLSHMPSLTSIYVDDRQLQVLPATVLAKLKKLQLYSNGEPTAKDKAALKACSQLESLRLCCDDPDDWLPDLPLHMPSIGALDVVMCIDDEHMPSLLALTHITSLTVAKVGSLRDDYSSAPCSWKHLAFTLDCTQDITKLPLHTLDSPVECNRFVLCLSDHAADLAAIRAAKPHLLRCGGISMKGGNLLITSLYASSITKEQAAEVLAEWAPCLSVPDSIISYASFKPIIQDAVARLWPAARLDC